MCAQGEAGRCAPGVPASPAGTCVNLGQSRWLMRYSAFGALIAGSDASERSFFGYDGEAQSPVTGLIYLRARHYDAASGRFGVADAYLGSAADPITQNRYLFCASDPVNHIDPSGHSLASLFSFATASSKRGAAIAQAYSVRAQARANSLAARVAASMRSISPAPGGRISTPTASQYSVKSVFRSGFERRYSLPRVTPKSHALQAIERYWAYYCGNAGYMPSVASNADHPESWKAMGRTMHEFAEVSFLLPVVSTGADWLAYVSEADVPMTTLFSFLTVSEVFSLGGSALLTKGGKITLGAGFTKVAGKTETAIASEGVKILGRGSTGRTEASGLLEEIAMREARKDPLHDSEMIIEELNDPIWSGAEGWSKYQRVFRLQDQSITIHFNYNRLTGEFDDFKFKNDPISH